LSDFKELEKRVLSLTDDYAVNSIGQQTLGIILGCAERMANRIAELESSGCGCCANEELCTQEVIFEVSYHPADKDIHKKINSCSAFERRGEPYGSK